MRNILRFTVLSLLVVMACDAPKPRLQKLDDDELIVRIKSRTLPHPTRLSIMNEQYDPISFDSMMTLFARGGYFQEFYKNENDSVVAMILRPEQPVDALLLNKINRALNEDPDVAIIDIDCTNLQITLNEIYRLDQGIRTGELPYDRSIDMDNLQKVVSIMERCPFPDKNVVGEQAVQAIWLVLQHSNLKYLKLYLPFLQKKAQEGVYQKSTIALSEDRVLMWEGKPQIYGSQVMNNELYDLEEPEYVDYRRAQVGLGPLSEYVARFGLEFNVPQKTPN